MSRAGRCSLTVLLTFGLFASDVQPIQALCHTFKTIDVLTPGGTIGTTSLLDVNNKKEIVGGFADSASPDGFLVSRKGEVTTIGLPARGGFVHGINHLGEMTGWYSTGAFPFLHGFFRDKKGVFTTLDVPGSDLTEAVGLNDRGQVVGDYRDAGSGVFHGFVWDAGVFSTIDVPFPGAISTAAVGINRFGDIVGFYDDANGRHGFVFKDGEFSTTVFPGSSSFTSLEDINDKGQIVGQYVGADAALHSFMFDDGVFSTIDVPFASVSTQVSGINDFGEFVGVYFDGERLHGLLAELGHGPLMFCS